MKIAIMQPYFFPYLGYFKLIEEADIFVFFNDVQYIRRGWINRNRIKSHNKDWQYITVPVCHCPMNTNIKDVFIKNEIDWHNKHIKTLENLYGSNKSIVNMYKKIDKKEKLQDLLIFTIIETCKILKINTTFLMSSDLELKEVFTENKATNKIIGLCLALGATAYINASGGKDLYREEDFKNHNISLEFLTPYVGNNLSVLDSLD